jgi:2-methylcitrate dehydratase PrpD
LHGISSPSILEIIHIRFCRIDKENTLTWHQNCERKSITITGNEDEQMASFVERLTDYIEKESIDSCDVETIQVVKAALTDIIACCIAGSQTEVAKIVNRFACQQWGTGNSSTIMSAEKMTSTGAALVNATMANALDIDDGHRVVKGHPGAVIFPAVLAAAEEYKVTGKEFLTALLIGYEVGIRAGMLAHQLRPEYHCTGSWGALGAAAGVSRIIGLDRSGIEQALGIAEYHSTYSPMMRCIDHPSMVKDGIGWGSMTGISSSYLAKHGFTGIPSLFSAEQAKPLINECGHLYRIHHLYYKPYSCCRWAQPAVEGIKYLIEQHNVSHRNIDKIVIHTFTESASLSKKYPKNTEEAQYNLPYPTAAYLVFGEVGPQQVLQELENKDILSIINKIEIRVNSELDEQFPEKALSQVEVYTTDHAHYVSPIMQAKGDYDYPLTPLEKKEKYFWLSTPLLGRKQSETLLQVIEQLDQLGDIRELTELLKK